MVREVPRLDDLPAQERERIAEGLLMLAEMCSSKSAERLRKMAKKVVTIQQRLEL
jgi:hypothetical protein